MSARWMTTVLVSGLVATFLLGYGLSNRSGIQAGYFEKAEAPAYGVGGGETLGAALGEEFQEHFEDLYQGIED